MLPTPKKFPPRRALRSALVRLVVVLLGLAAAGGCARSERPQSVDDEWQDAVRPVSESWDVRYTVNEAQTREGESRPRLHMDAGYMASYETDSTYTLLQASEDTSGGTVRAVIFDLATGDTSAVVVAERIIYRDDERRFEAVGSVVVDGRQDRHMWSERLFWDERARRIHAPGFVRIVTPRERIEGYNLDSDEDLDNYSLERVTGEVDVEDDDEAHS